MSEWVRGRLFDGERGVLAGPRRPRAPGAVRKIAVPSIGAGAADIPEIPAFEELEVPAPPLIEIISLAPAIAGVERCRDCGEQLRDGHPLECRGALPHRDAEGVIAPLPSPPLPECLPMEFTSPRHKFKRHPKCTTEKCERLGNSCALCRMANAIGF